MNSELRSSTANWTDIQIYCYSQFAGLTLDFPIVGYDPELAYPQPSVPFVTFLVFNAQPDARGTVRVQSLSAYDRRNLQYGVDMTRNSNWGKQYIKKELFPAARYGGSDDLHRRLNLCSAYYQAGTCALGIKNVRVCDISLFPTQLNVNPTYTLFGLCEKVAGFLKKE